jgi:hypothetical protein
MASSSTSSLALRLKEDKESFLKSFYEQTPASLVLTHFLDLHESYECASCREPMAAASAPELAGRTEDDVFKLTQMLVWCMPCNRIFHLICAGFKELDKPCVEPWVCSECQKETKETKTSPSILFTRDNQELANKAVVERISLLRIKVPRWTSRQHISRKALYDSLNLRYTTSGNLEKVSVEKFITKIHTESLKSAEKLAKSEKLLAEKDKEIAELKKNQFWDKPSASSTHKFSFVGEQKRLTIRDLIDGTLLGHDHEDLSKEESPQQVTQRQSDIVHTEASLREIRASLPKIKKFSGEPLEWLQYEHNVESNIEQGQFTGRLAKNVIRDSLDGEPYDRLHTMLHSEDFSYTHVMTALRKDYGHGRKVIEAHKIKILELSLKPLTYEAVRKATTVIMNYLNACSQAKVEFLDSQLSRHIHDQLDDTTKKDYHVYFARNCPGQTRDERLDVQVTFLQSIADSLPFEKQVDSSTKSFQLCAIASSTQDANHNNRQSAKNGSSSSRSNTNEDSKFRMLDCQKDFLRGYNWQRVNACEKMCFMCNKKNHYTPQCTDFQALTVQLRSEVVDSKNLCACCLLTDEHRANQCDFRLGCGVVTGNFVCSLKHHASLHKSASVRNKNSNKQSESESNDNSQDEESHSKAHTTEDGNQDSSKYKSSIKIPNTRK